MTEDLAIATQRIEDLEAQLAAKLTEEPAPTGDLQMEEEEIVVEEEELPPAVPTTEPPPLPPSHEAPAPPMGLKTPLTSAAKRRSLAAIRASALKTPVFAHTPLPSASKPFPPRAILHLCSSVSQQCSARST